MKKNKKNTPETDTEDMDNSEVITDETPEEELTETAGETDAEMAAELEQLQAENKKLKEDFLRAFADAENIKKRCAQEIEKNNKYAISSFAKSL